MEDITLILENLPSKEGYEKNFNLEEADIKGINACGESEEGHPLYKFLAKEGVMLTYHLKNNKLYYQRTEKLHQ
jgi:hypothetical protein